MDAAEDAEDPQKIVDMRKAYDSLAEEIVILSKAVKVIRGITRGEINESQGIADETKESDAVKNIARSARIIMDIMRSKIYEFQGTEDDINRFARENCERIAQCGLCSVCESVGQTHRQVIIAIEDLPIGR
jgi:hypothetical protein